MDGHNWKKDLGFGDQFYWNDPDNGACSKVVTIRTIEWMGEVARIEDVDGSVLECFDHEME
jgi:hypothetical protein